MWDIALSTMWSFGLFNHLKEFFSAAQTLGFRQFELNHQVNSKMLNGLDFNRFRITSVHEPCPSDITTDSLKARNWLVSALDEDCRRQGVRAARRSIDLARQIGAHMIVVHLGRVDVDAQMERKLWDLFEAGKVETLPYEALKEEIIAARAAQAGANLDAVRRSLVDLAEYAGHADIQLGLENRYHYLEIPLPHEMDMLLELADDGRLGFWYDVGHAQVFDRLGFYSHETWLRRYAPRMLGAHLHDVRGLQDHLAAGLGEVDWEMVAAYLPEEVLRVCEVRGHNTPDQMTSAMQFLTHKGLVKTI
jgi:sugar phosphate isomerase/epimerase